MFEIRALRRIFGPKRDEVTREWRKLHSRKNAAFYLRDWSAFVPIWCAGRSNGYMVDFCNMLE